MMEKERYREALSRLPIKNPTPSDMAHVCPHLTKIQAVEAFSDKFQSVACPPLKVDGAFQLISLQKSWDGRIRGGQILTEETAHPPQLIYAQAGRTYQSQSKAKAKNYVFHAYPYLDKAIQFAENTWGDELMLDTWEDTVEFYLYKPSCSNQKPFRCYVCLNRKWIDVLHDQSKKQALLMDQAIVTMTLDPLVWNELKIGHSSSIQLKKALSPLMTRFIWENYI